MKFSEIQHRKINTLLSILCKKEYYMHYVPEFSCQFIFAYKYLNFEKNHIKYGFAIQFDYENKEYNLIFVVITAKSKIINLNSFVVTFDDMTYFRKLLNKAKLNA